jgi:hypothetical protein
LWYRLVQQPPKPLSDLCPDLDADVERIVMRAHEKNPLQRFPDMEVMRRDVARVRRRLTPTEVAALVGKAERAFAAREFGKALSSAREALALDPDHTQAIDVADRTKAAIDAERNRQRQEAERQAEDEGRARAAIADADRRVADDDIQGALAELAAFAPPHPLVAARIDELARQTKDRLAKIAALHEQRQYGEALKAIDKLLMQVAEGPGDVRADIETLRDRIEDDYTTHIIELERQHTDDEHHSDTDRVPDAPVAVNDVIEPAPVTHPVTSETEEDDGGPTQVIARPSPPSPQNSPRRKNS